MIFHPETIEAELASIQRRASPTEARTSILNLVVFSRGQADATADRALGYVLGKRAARIIHIAQTEDKESDVHVSARCYLDRERKSVCFQEVLIQNGRDNVGEAPGSWTPLLIRDLPVYVLWLENISDRRALLAQVQEQADKLIIDAEQNVHSGESAVTVFEALSDAVLTRGIVLADFTWRRLLPLRRLTAQVFDAESTLERLYATTRVELTGGPEVYGKLYLSWLASRLGWQAEGSRFVDPQRGGAEVKLLHSSPAPAEAGVTVDFQFERGRPISIEAVPGGCAEITGAPHLSRRQLFTVPEMGEMLLAEIDSVSNETLYTDAMSTLATAFPR